MTLAGHLHHFQQGEEAVLVEGLEGDKASEGRFMTELKVRMEAWDDSFPPHARFTSNAMCLVPRTTWASVQRPPHRGLDAHLGQCTRCRAAASRPLLRTGRSLGRSWWLEANQRGFLLRLEACQTSFQKPRLRCKCPGELKPLKSSPAAGPRIAKPGSNGT